MLTQRENWIDIAKGWGISLVVYGHIQRGLIKAKIIPDTAFWHYLDSLIYSFHMPLFFILSGYFLIPGLQKHGTSGLFVNKLKSLVYPYLIWSLAQGMLEVLGSAMTNNQTHWSEVLSLLWAPRAQFWFLYVLFLLFLLAILSSKLLLSPNQRNALALWIKVLLPATLLARLLKQLDPFPFPLDFICDFAFYFFLGAAIHEYREALLRLGSKLLSAQTLGCAAVLLACLTLSHGIQEATPAGRLPQTLAACLALMLGQFCASLAGSWMIISMSLFISKTARLASVRMISTLLQNLGQAALAIYLMHIVFGSGIRIVLQKFLHLDTLALHLAAGLILSLLLPYLLYRLSQHRKLSFLRYTYEWHR